MKGIGSLSKLGALAAVAVTAALIAGCGSSNSAGVPASTFARAADVSSSAAGEKVTVALTEQVNSKTISLTGTGAFSRSPVTGELTMDVDEDAKPLGTLSEIMADGDIYMRLPSALSSQMSRVTGGKPWVSINLTQLASAAKIPGFSSLLNQDAVNPAEALRVLGDASTNGLTKVGMATINRIRTTEYAATLDLAKEADAVPASQRATVKALLARYGSVMGSTIPVEVWIDDSDLIRQVVESPTLTIDGQSLTMHMKEDITSYAKQAVSSPPAASETYNMTRLLEKQAHAAG